MLQRKSHLDANLIPIIKRLMIKTKKVSYLYPETTVMEVLFSSGILSGSNLAGVFDPEDLDTGGSSGAGVFLPED